MKRFISVLMSVWLVLLFVVASPVRVQAEVLEPEVVRTETWTTSYYIDDEVDTLYPYIECKAEIYNDGTLKIYYRNTYEWSGFRTVRHTCTIVGTAPVRKDSTVYLAKKGLTMGYCGDEQSWSYFKAEKEPLLENIDVNYYDRNYTFGSSYHQFFGTVRTEGRIEKQRCRDEDKSTDDYWFGSYYYTGYLCDLYTDIEEYLTFIPKIEPTDTYNF